MATIWELKGSLREGKEFFDVCAFNDPVFGESIFSPQTISKRQVCLSGWDKPYN